MERERQREGDMRQGRGEKGKGTRSEREQPSVMLECINIQLTCHAPCIRQKNIQIHSIMSVFIEICLFPETSR